MIARQAMSVATPPASGDDERSLLIRLEHLLDREEETIVARDAAALVAIAEEREAITQRVADAARTRRAAPRDTADEHALIEIYRRLRQRHDVRAQVVRRGAERNARAIGVLAQATGQTNLYNADGRVTMQFVSP